MKFNIGDTVRIDSPNSSFDGEQGKIENIRSVSGAGFPFGVRLGEDTWTPTYFNADELELCSPDPEIENLKWRVASVETQIENVADALTAESYNRETLDAMLFDLGDRLSAIEAVLLYLVTKDEQPS